MDGPDSTRPDSPQSAEHDIVNDPLYRFNKRATIAFVVAALVATAFPDRLDIPFAVFSCILSAVGTVAFLWAYGKALGRSRDEDVSVAMVYGMTGVSPRHVSRRFHLLTAIQAVVSITTAAIHPFTPQAFGILACMLGIGLAGLWAATHGTFAERKDGRHKAREMNRTKHG